jgi:hypothetical protein
MLRQSEDPQKQSRLGRWWTSLTGNRSGRAGLDNLDPNELGNIARDLGASASELRAIAGKWPDSADLLTRRMEALHLDPIEIAQAHPVVSGELNKLCSLCRDKHECKHDLERDPINPRWRRYCPNSQTLIALVTGRQAKQTTSGE